VFQGAKAIEHPSSATASDPVAAALATGPRASRDVTSTHTRLYALPIVQTGRRLGTVVAGVSLSPYEQTRRTGLFASAVLRAGDLHGRRAGRPLVDLQGAAPGRANDEPGG